MAIAKMKLMNIIADKKYLEEVLLRFHELDNFHPELATKIVDRVHGLTTLQDENPYTEIMNRFQDIYMDMGMVLTESNVKKRDCDLQKVKDYIEGVYEEYKQIASVKKELLEVIQENKDALVQVENIESMDISLDDIFSCKYLRVRFGRLPIDSIDKLQFYKNHPFIFNSFNVDHNYSWCVYFTTPKYEGEVDNIFSSLYFERIRIPDFVHGTPEKAKEMLRSEIDNDYVQLAYVDEKLDELLASCKEHFCDIQAELAFLHQTFDARKYVVNLGERFSITGFVAEDDVEEVKATFHDLQAVELEVLPAHSDKRLTPPTKLKNGWFTRPFAMFVEMYGMPNYEDIDPTPFVALTYTLLFGVMFGDLGQGLVLSLVGYLAYKWKGMKLGEVGVRIGLSSAFFGLVFGSVFGDEELLNPMFHALGFKEKPIHIMGSDFIMPLLIMAIGIGVILIICSICINIYIHFKRKDYSTLFFSPNGLAGITLYAGLIGGVVAQFLFDIAVFNGIYILLVIILPLFIMFLQEPLHHKLEGKEMFPEGFGGFFTQSFFELFEICLSFITNTISYLRVGGFVLSHAGMMLVVTLLMEMSGGAGIIVAIIGNIFVMCLEGMIVGIQVLRLEFYEMFSRYFTGDGIAFKSLKDN